MLAITCIILTVTTKSVSDEIYYNKKYIDDVMVKYTELYKNITHLRGHVSDTMSNHSTDHVYSNALQGSMIQGVATNLTLNIKSVKKFTTAYHNISEILTTLMAYRDEFRSNFTVVFNKIKHIDKIIKFNNNRTINSTTLILKKLNDMVIVKNRYFNKTENVTGFILEKLNKIFIDNAVINNSISNIRDDIDDVRQDVKQSHEGYKIFWNNCPYNWTVSGYLKPFYICTK